MPQAVQFDPDAFMAQRQNTPTFDPDAFMAQKSTAPYHPGFLESAWNTLSAIPGDIWNTVRHPVDSSDAGQYVNSLNAIKPEEWAQANKDAALRAQGKQPAGPGIPAADWNSFWPTLAEAGGRMAGQAVGDAALAAAGYGLGKIPYSDIGTGITAAAPNVTRGLAKVGGGMGLGWLESKLPLPGPVVTGLELSGAPIMYQGGKQILSGLGEGIDAYRDSRYGPVLGPDVKPKGFKMPKTAKTAKSPVPESYDSWTPTITPREPPVQYPAGTDYRPSVEPEIPIPSKKTPDYYSPPAAPAYNYENPPPLPPVVGQREPPVQYPASVNYDPNEGRPGPLPMNPAPRTGPTPPPYQVPFEPKIIQREPPVQYAAARNYNPTEGQVPSPITAPAGNRAKITGPGRGGTTVATQVPTIQPIAGGSAPAPEIKPAGNNIVYPEGIHEQLKPAGPEVAITHATNASAKDLAVAGRLKSQGVTLPAFDAMTDADLNQHYKALNYKPLGSDYAPGKRVGRSAEVGRAHLRQVLSEMK